MADTTGCHSSGSDSSATNIYTDQPPSSGLCTHKKVSHPSTKSGGPSVTPPTSNSTPPPVKLTHKVSTKINHAPKDKRALLHKVATDPSLGAVQALHFTKVAALGPPPSAVSAAFDLGAGPTALFAALLAVAALLALGGGLHHRGRSKSD
jgi:hypothetical protein